MFDFQHGRTNRFIQTHAHTCLQITFRIYQRPNTNALPVPCIHRFMFLGVVLGVVSCALLGGSKTALEANMAPTWVDFGDMLVIFGAFLGVVLASQLKTALRFDFDRFLIDFRPLGGTKNIEKTQGFLKIFVFLLDRS